ncbi:class I SAM-dependent methyltransferase [Dongia sp.]|uniref:class I SAM-dependent methyltransferase n=1 Tax=Dongia sp. TaxID=1977262 RepID=UPI003750B840
MPDRDWWAALWPDPTATLRALGIEPWMSALDLCCGDGYFTAPLAALVNGQAYALDNDPTMIRSAQIEVARQGASVRQWFCADADLAAELIPEPIDYVLMANTFHGVPDKPALFRTMRDVLRPGGLFGIVNWHPLPRETTTVLGKPRGPGTEMRISAEAVRAIAEAAGFQCAQIVNLAPYHYGIVIRAGD